MSVRRPSSVASTNLDIIEVLFLHSLELGDPGGDAAQVVLDSIFWAP